jgi:hypothetical protein
MTNSLDLTWGRVIPIWWAMVWRAFIVGTLMGAVAGAVAGALYVLIGGPPTHSVVVGAIAGYVLSVPVSMWALRVGLRKRYRGFHVELLPSA